jgi:hypothetical protein
LNLREEEMYERKKEGWKGSPHEGRKKYTGEGRKEGRG